MWIGLESIRFRAFSRHSGQNSYSRWSRNLPHPMHTVGSIISAKQLPSQNGNLSQLGIFAMFLFQIFENIGMVMGLVPITGIPLPLLSYGGSSILGTLIALSLILNISAKTKKYMFEQDSTRDL